ncbi:hypothetical protein RND81_14G027200 [Saponaria officinalis]|uniref:26S proteasome non-ATPase regulatory subunit 2 homolog n=1 Tax=Saponaria officinalis TaxID=3572 RepID=A0AAW1GMP8_SAPOF
MASKKNTKEKDKKKDEHLSKEDLQLKQELELYVKNAQNPDVELQRAAIESMRQEVQRSISSMTSVPKTLKFLRPQYEALKSYYDTMQDSELKRLLADILSGLALTMSTEGKRESLKYNLLGTDVDIELWGHEYVRNLAEEIRHEWAKLLEEDDFSKDLEYLAYDIFDYFVKHNAELEAVDIMTEVNPERLISHVSASNYKRACSYLTATAKYLAGPDDELVLDTVFAIYLARKEFVRALQIALFLYKLRYVRQIFEACDDLLQKQQFCFILARHGVHFELDDNMVMDDDDREQLQAIINNFELRKGFLSLARDIEVMEAKSPEDIYKAHLLSGRASVGTTVDSEWQNLAATFMNAFVNAGFRQDKLMTDAAEASSGVSSCNWLFMNTGEGKISAAASLGMILLWDIGPRGAKVYKLVRSKDSFVIAGALLGVGIMNCGINHDLDPALRILRNYVDKGEPTIRICAIMGLGIAYANTKDYQIRDMLIEVLQDTNTALDVIAFTSISLGLVFVGSSDGDVAEVISEAARDHKISDLGDPLSRLLPLGLGLIYLGKQDGDIVDFFQNLNKKSKKHCDITLFSCAYAGTGNINKVQLLLRQCTRQFDKCGVDQRTAVLGIAMIAMAEEIGLNMAIRSLEHLLQYGELNIRRAVPLALALLCISDPKVTVMDTLSRLTHDPDSEVAMAAIISLGLVAAGTNNARVAAWLRSLSSYYCNNASALFCVRIAQGLVHLGKGLLTLNPYHSDRFLLSPCVPLSIAELLRRNMAEN